MKSPFGNIVFRRVVAAEIILLTTIMAYFLYGGEDLYRFYLPMAKGCTDCSYNPWFAVWVFFPLQFIPLRFLWTFWVLVTGIVYAWACEKLNTNSLIVLLSFPTFGLLWLGQTDAVVLLGIALIMLSPSPYIRGLGIVLAAVKPHVSVVALLVLFWMDDDRWKTLIVPALVGAASLIVWGVDWPLRWIQAGNLADNSSGPITAWGASGIGVFGLPAFLGIFLVKSKAHKVAVAIIGMALVLSRFGVYSYGLFMVFAAPWWSLPLSYAWILSYPWFGNMGMQFAWVLPLGILIYLIWPDMKERYDRWKSARNGSGTALKRAEHHADQDSESIQNIRRDLELGAGLKQHLDEILAKSFGRLLREFGL